MSDTPRPARARRLTAPVRPGRDTDYRDPAAARLHKIAAERRTGRLPFAGSDGGAIYVQDGKVVYAESRRTPGTPATAALARSAAGEQAGVPPGYPLLPARSVTEILAVAEPTVDAALELMSGESRPSRFRPASGPAAGRAPGISVAALLAEVARRQRLLGQMATVLTADTAIVRSPHLPHRSIRVSARQWALLIRVQDGSTPRDLAWALSRSVFSMTAEVYRLLTLRLVAVDHGPRRKTGPDEAPARRLAALSFIRAVSVEKGDTMPLRTPGAGSGIDR